MFKREEKPPFIFKLKPDGKPIQPISPERKAEMIARARQMRKKEEPEQLPGASR